MGVSTATERPDSRYVSERIRKPSVTMEKQTELVAGEKLSSYLTNQWNTDKECEGYFDGSILDFRFVYKKPVVTNGHPSRCVYTKADGMALWVKALAGSL